MAKILITGGAGFIGSQLGLHLARTGQRVVLLDNMTAGYEDNVVDAGARFAELVVKDVRDPDLSAEIRGTDTIFHFAGISMLPKCQAEPTAAYDNNVTGLVNVLEWARREGVKRVVFSSTSAVYENNTSLPFRESDAVAPDLVYASTKLAGEAVCRAFAITYGLDVAIARFFNVYGEHMDIHRTMPPFVSYLAREVLHGRRPVLFNNSDAARDYVYVSDVVDCLLRLAAFTGRFAGDVFNVCSGHGFSVKELVAAYSEVSGTSIEPIYRDPTTYWDNFPRLFEGRPLDRARIAKEVYKTSIGDPRTTRDTLGFQAAVPLAEGLRRVHAFSLTQFGS